MDTQTHYQKVFSFMSGANQLNNICPPNEPSNSEKILRAKLILEEALEQVDALGVSLHFDDNGKIYNFDENLLEYVVTHSYNAQAVLDACCDINVINTGTAITCGFNERLMSNSQSAVDLNNLSKLDGPNGPIFREDGKLLKPEGYVPVDAELQRILQQEIVSCQTKTTCCKSE